MGCLINLLFYQIRDLLIGFRLSAWLTMRGESASLNPLSSFLQSELLEDHGIENMMQSPSCSRTGDPNYSAALGNGWKSGKLNGTVENKC